LPLLLDRLEEADGAAEPVPSADGWELMLAENVAHLVDDERRWRALGNLRRTVGLAPEQILAAPEAVLREVVAGAGSGLPLRGRALGGRPGPSGQVDPRHLAHLAGVA
jgi:hypothetical protein